MANQLTQDVSRILTEILGGFIAQATLKKNCDLIGTTPEALAAVQLPQLAEKIEKSVSFFNGKEAGSEAARRILALSG